MDHIPAGSLFEALERESFSRHFTESQHSLQEREAAWKAWMIRARQAAAYTEALVLKSRAQGRAESLAIVLSMAPDAPFEGCIATEVLGAGREPESIWLESELRSVLQVDDEAYDAFDKARAAALEFENRKSEAEKTVALVVNSQNCVQLEELLLANEQFELLGVLTTGRPGIVRVPDELLALGAELRTQDNRATAAPIFIVQQKRAYVVDEAYNDSRTVWLQDRLGDRSEVSPLRALRLERLFQGRYCEVPEGYERLALMDIWEFVTACLTEEGCNDYLRLNGHNLKEPRVYAAGSYRNNEYRAVRDWLISLPVPADNVP